MAVTLESLTQQHFKKILRYVSKNQTNGNSHPVASRLSSELIEANIKGSNLLEKWNNKGYFKQLILLLTVYGRSVTQSYANDKGLMHDLQKYIDTLIAQHDAFTSHHFDIYHYYFIKLARYIMTSAHEIHLSTKYLSSEKRGYALNLLEHLENRISTSTTATQNFDVTTLTFVSELAIEHDKSWQHYNVKNHGRFGEILGNMGLSHRPDEDLPHGDHTPHQEASLSFDTTLVQSYVSAQLAELPRWAVLRKYWLQQLLARPSVEAYAPDITKGHAALRKISPSDVAKITCLFVGLTFAVATIAALASQGVGHSAWLHTLQTWLSSLSAPNYAEAALTAVGGAGIACFAYQRSKVAYQCKTIENANTQKDANPLIFNI